MIHGSSTAREVDVVLAVDRVRITSVKGYDASVVPEMAKQVPFSRIRSRLTYRREDRNGDTGHCAPTLGDKTSYAQRAFPPEA